MTYDVVWDGGRLGLAFKPDGDGMPKVRRVNPNGEAAGLKHAKIGDVLIQLNGQDAEALGFEEVVSQLKTGEFPMRLTFQSGTGRGSDLPRGTSVSTLDGSDTFSRQTTINNQEEDVLPQEEVEDDVAQPMGRDEYEIVWEEGTLGITLKEREESTVVRKITGFGCTNGLHNISEGDTLVSVNDSYTRDMGFTATMKMLKYSPKPVILRFSRAPVTNAASSNKYAAFEDEAESNHNNNNNHHSTSSSTGSGRDTIDAQGYSVTWGDEPLGIALRENNAREVYIDRLTGKGLAARTNSLALGDVLVSIAEIAVADLGFKQSINFLKSVQKPVELVFKREGSDPYSNYRAEEQKTDPAPVVAPPPQPTLNQQNSYDSSYSDLDDSGYANSSRKRREASYVSSYSDLDDSLADTSQSDFQSFEVDADELHDILPPKDDLVLQWKEGPLGITLKKTHEGHVLVSRLTGKGYTSGLTELTTGDELVGVNEFRTREIGFTETMNMLKTLPKPVTLSFLFNGN